MPVKAGPSIRLALAMALAFVLHTGEATRAQTTWYSYQSGYWNDTEWRIWTTDPSGTTLVNPSMLGPAAGDEVIILNGRTITIPEGTGPRTVASVTIQEGAVLDITGTEGHNFGSQLNGSGLLRLSTASFPDFAAGTFVNEGGGTVEYRNAGSFTLTQFVYNNVVLDLASGTAEALYDNATELTVHGDLTVRSGTLRIGSSSGTLPLTVRIDGNTLVGEGGQIAVGQKNNRHSIFLGGDLINNGIVRFTTLNAPRYTLDPPAGEGYSDVIFNNDRKDQHLVCNGITAFWRIEILKGSDRTYVLNIDAAGTDYFNLFGRNNLVDYSGENLANPNALGLRTGTCRLGEGIRIPCLATQSYQVPEAACLWLDGAAVTFTTVPDINHGLYLYGKLKITAGGSMDVATHAQRGVVMRDASEIELDNGHLSAKLLRTSAISLTNRGTFIMRGNSTVDITGNTFTGTDAAASFASFSMGYRENVMDISGGVINIANPSSVPGSGQYFSLHLGCDLKNTNITGGTFNITIPEGSNAYINSTVPLWDLNLLSANAAREARVAGYVNSSGAWFPPTLSPQPLVVLHDLNLKNGAVLNNPANVDVLTGRNFTIAPSATYVPGANTTWFNGAGTQEFDVQGTIQNDLNNLAVTNASTLILKKLTGSGTLVVKGDFRLDHGCVLADNGNILELRGNAINSGTHFRPVSGAGSIRLTGTGNQYLSGDGTGIFNNLSLNKTSGEVFLLADFQVTGDLRLGGISARLNTGSNSLTLGPLAGIYDNLSGTGMDFSESRMIVTGGLMSDGGLSKVYGSTDAFLFPVGFFNPSNSAYYYTPVSIRFREAPAVYGTVTTRPVNARHPLLQSPSALAVYWKTTSSGFSGVIPGSVEHRYTYDPLSNYFVSGDESAYVPAVFRDNQAGWTVVSNTVLVNDGTNTVTYDTAYAADGDYTAGEPSVFAVPTVRYSSGEGGDWDNPASWSSEEVGGTGGASVPDSNTLVIIGDESHNHTITISQDNRSCATLSIAAGSVLDLGNFRGHNFATVAAGGVNGAGTLRIASSGYFPAGDFGNFLSPAGGTVEYYTLPSVSIDMPVASDATDIRLDHYGNLVLHPSPGTTITLPDTDIHIYNDLVKKGGGQARTNTQSAHLLTVGHDLNVAEGLLEVRNGNIQNIRVMGNMKVNGIFRVESSAAVSHTLELNGNLEGEGSFNAYNAPGRILVYFRGGKNAAMSGAAKNFYSLEIDKGSSPEPVLDVTCALTTNFDPALTLRNGTFRLSAGNLNVTAGSSFTIPATACLSAGGGTLNIVTTNSASHLYLVGMLEVLAGTVNIGNTSAVSRSDIEYASGGQPTLTVKGGTLNVKGQIRRNTLTAQGSLRYQQSGGTVNIIGRNAEATRAKLEVCNEGSLFTLSGGTLRIYRGGGTDYGDLYLRPDSAAVTGGTIVLGPPSALGSQTYHLDASCNLHNLSILSYDAANRSEVLLMVNPLHLSGSLVIGTSSTLAGGGKNIFVQGEFTNSGTFAPGAGTMTFNGSGAQTATFLRETAFSKLVIDKPESSVVRFTGTNDSRPTVNDTLTIDGGTLVNEGNLNVIVLGNIVNNGIHASTGTGSLLLKGARNQVISGNGSGAFGNLNVSNGAGNGVTLTADAAVTGTLTLTSGYFYINDYLLTMGPSSSVVTSADPDSCNWIITNGTLSDAGVRKVFPAASPSSFTFPVGVAGKYTPVTYSLTYDASSPGSITLKPVNSSIPSLTNAPGDELQYYWHVTSTPFGSLNSASHSYQYLDSDVRGTESGYTAARYVQLQWTDLGKSAVNTANHTINLTGGYIDGEYTAGESLNFRLKPVYYSYDQAPGIGTTGGDWNTAGSWATGSHNGTVAETPPDGNPLVIKAGHRINVRADDRYAYSVLNDGILDLGSSTGHSLGHVSGSGRTIIANTLAAQFVFPGGDFTSYMNTPGSTVEYSGSNGTPTSAMLPTQKKYRNVEMTGPINKDMACVNLLVKGNLMITGSRLSNTLYNKNITLWGDWNEQVSDGFAPGRGWLNVEGTTPQTIQTTAGGHFYNVKMNNEEGLTLAGNVYISNLLELVNGRINTGDENLLVLNSASTSAVSGGSGSSFVDGPLSKRILAQQHFIFPTGNYNGMATEEARYGPLTLSGVSTSGFWTARYINANPQEAGYDRSSLLFPISTVSDNEYWIVNRPEGGNANVTLRWDGNSGIADPSTVRVAEWVIPENRWEEKGNAASGTETSGTVSTTTPVTTGSYVFTLGISGTTARITGMTPAAICDNGETIKVTVELTGKPAWQLTYQAGSKTFVQQGITSPTYDILLSGEDLGGPGTYELKLMAVSDVTGTGITEQSVFQVTVNRTYKPDIRGSDVAGAGETRSFFTTANAGSSYRWNWQTADGGEITDPDEASTEVVITTPASFPQVYLLRVTETSDNGCAAEDVQSVTVLSNPSPVISPADPNVCVDEVVSYSTPRVQGHTYQWTVYGGTPATGTGNSIQVTWNTTGNGWVAVREDTSGISGTDTLFVIVDPKPNAALAVTSPPETICPASAATITVSASQTGFTYQLINRQDNIPVGTPAAGTGGTIGLSTGPLSSSSSYNILVYNNGCTGQLMQTASVTVGSPPAPSGDSVQVFCSGDDPLVSDLQAGGAGIKWYPTATGSTALDPATPLTDGRYYAGQSTSGGCESTARLAVRVTVGLTPSTSAISGDDTPECYERGLVYSVLPTPGSTYAWTVPQGSVITSGDKGPDNPSVTVNIGNTGGLITVVETSVLGCAGSPQSLFIGLPECGPLAAFAADDTVICRGGSVVFTDKSLGTAPDATYAWNFGEGASPATATSAGPHTVSYSTPGSKSVTLTVTTTSSGTITKADYITVNPEPVVDLGNDTVICYGNTLILDAGDDFISWLWSTGATSPSIAVSEGAGAVSVTVTDKNGCRGSDAINILPCDPGELLGKIPNAFTPNGDNIHDSWVIPNIHMFPDARILVYDRWGRLVFETDGGYDNDWYGKTADGRELPVDTYYYVIDLRIPGSQTITGNVSIIR